LQRREPDPLDLAQVPWCGEVRQYWVFAELRVLWLLHFCLQLGRRKEFASAILLHLQRVLDAEWPLDPLGLHHGVWSQNMTHFTESTRRFAICEGI
jgi:fructosamine-3-kinase